MNFVRLTFTFFLMFSCTIGFGQKIEDSLYEITIQSGAGTYGDMSIKFQLEGMILRTFITNEKNISERKVDFVPVEQIDSRQMLKIFEYIQKYNLMNLKNEYIANPYYPVDIKIRILDMNNGNYIEHRYNKYSQIFDGLIVMMNDLIPKEYRLIYQTNRIK